MDIAKVAVGKRYWIDAGRSIVEVVSLEQWREKIWPHNHYTVANVVGISRDIEGEEMSMRPSVFCGPVVKEH